jgi:hypothetical protein
MLIPGYMKFKWKGYLNRVPWKNSPTAPYSLKTTDAYPAKLNFPNLSH